MSKSARRSAQGGFTLIELVVVIVILGMLAAFAIPRFAKMDVSARAATVRALEASLRRSSTTAHGMRLANARAPGRFVTSITGTTMTFRAAGAPNNSDRCLVSYTPPATANGLAAIVSDVREC
jgi:MSHA pilin protein MshA